MRLVAIVARRDYVRTVKRRGFIAGTLLLPAAMGAIFAISAFFSTAGGDGPLGQMLVVDASEVTLATDAALTPHIVVVSQADADALIANGTATDYYLVPSTWPAQPQIRHVFAGSRGAGSPIEALTRQQAGQAEIELMLRLSILRSAGLSDETLAQLLSPTQISSITTTGEPVSDASVIAGFALPYLFTLIFVLSIFITSGYLLQSVTEEKENRVVEIVLSSIPALPLMAGKVLGLGAAGLTQVVIWLATALIAIPLINAQLSLDLTLSPIQLVLAVLFFCLGYLGYGAIFAAVGAVAPGAREGQQYSSFFGFFAVVPVIATPLFVSDPNSPIVWALALFPLTAPAASLELMSLPYTPWLTLLASLISQIVFVVVAVFLAGRVFRATLLLYGTRPSMRRLVSALTSRS